MAVALIVLAAVALVIVAAAVLPLLSVERGAGADDAGAERRRVQEDLERSLAAIREIEHDHAAGNLSDDDFEALDQAERARAVGLLRRRDELDGAGAR